MPPAIPRAAVWTCAAVTLSTPVLTAKPRTLPVAVSTPRMPPPTPVEVEPVVSWVLSSEASFTAVGVTSSCPRIAPPLKSRLWMLKYMFPAWKAVMSAAASAAALSGTNQWFGPPTSGIVMPPAIPRAAV